MVREVAITSEMKRSALQKARELPALKNSITSGQGNLVGFLGEEVAKFVLGGTLSNTYDYDLILDSGKTVDVKTKKTGFEPKPHYECSVAEYNTKQKCDYYAFVRVDDQKDRAWFLGVYEKDAYYRDAKLLKKGDIDPSNNFVVKANCYNLPIHKLQELDQ